MTSYRCIVILLAFLLCFSSAAPITFSTSIDNTLPSPISNESQQSSMIPSSWSSTERGTSSLFHDFIEKYATFSLSRSKTGQALSNQHSSNLRRRIARRRHP